jgi:hypothetical protein
MTSRITTVAGDGHFHLYPCYDPADAINRLARNLGIFARLSTAGQAGDVFRIAFLAEGGQFNYFRKIQDRELKFDKIGLEISPGPEEHCVSFSKQGRPELCLVAGRQIVTGEKLEILGLAMEEIVPDGLPAEETIEKVIAAGGLPVLAFSPGKWFFKRGKIALKLAKYYGKALVIGDSALRPPGWGRPAVMRNPRAAVLPGSDPLPLAGEEKYAGCYGFVYRGEFDADRPLAAMKRIIADFPSAIVPAGLRCPFFNVAARLFRLRRKAEGRR